MSTVPFIVCSNMYKCFHSVLSLTNSFILLVKMKYLLRTKLETVFINEIEFQTIFLYSFMITLGIFDTTNLILF